MHYEFYLLMSLHPSPLDVTSAILRIPPKSTVWKGFTALAKCIHI
jgi:hypothetical protein